MRLKAGQYVRHSKYGWGTVMEWDPDQTMVYFRTIGVKKLATSSANFAMVGGEDPQKARHLKTSRAGKCFGHARQAIVSRPVE